MSESHATLSYQSDVDIHGFQLNVSGVELIMLSFRSSV